MKKYTLSVIIPCYNEKEHVEQLVKRVLSAPVKNKETIIVDDKSTDGSAELIDDIISPMVTKVIHHETNSGKGAAIRTGIQNATGDIVIIQDADLEYDPQDYVKIITPIIKGRCKVCYGSRFMGGV